MAKIQKLSDIQQEIAFTEYDFYQRYVETFKKSELGRIKSLLPLREMAISFGLIEEKPKSTRVKRGRKSFFTPEVGYWTNERSTSKVDFVIQHHGEVIPIEVKSGENLHSRSFTHFCQTYQPKLAIKTSILPYQTNNNIQNIPLYGISAYIQSK